MTQTTNKPITWHRVSDPADGDQGPRRFLKWNEVEVGGELEGIWQGFHQGQYGLLGSVEVRTGEIVSFPLPTLLHRRLDCVEPGRRIKIVYLGKRDAKDGDTSYHTFDCYSDRPALGPGAAQKALVQFTDDETPEQTDGDVPF